MTDLCAMNRVQSEREARGWTREQLGLKASVSREYIRLLEIGAVRTPALESARKVASALGVTVDELFPSSAAKLVAPVSSKRRRVA
jgi:transcriptional regulator with XRE-family HTH domain